VTSQHEYWALQASKPLFEVHGDTAVHKAAVSGTETSVTVLVGEFNEGEEVENGQVVLRVADVTVTNGDYLTYNSRTWRVVSVVTEEDGLYACELVRAREVT
jgi:hypothetical protein